MRNPTPVTTMIITTERASRVKEMLGENHPAVIHCHRTNVKEPPAGGETMNIALAAAAAANERPTDPAPTAAVAPFGNLPPKMASTRNPASGSAGMHQVQVNISGPSPGDIRARSHRIRVQGF